MFGKKAKRIEELENLCRSKDEKIYELKFKVRSAELKLDAIDRRMNAAEDCTEGKWCDGCIFQQVVRHTFLDGHRDGIRFCNKGNTCKHFVKKGEEE